MRNLNNRFTLLSRRTLDIGPGMLNKQECKKKKDTLVKTSCKSWISQLLSLEQSGLQSRSGTWATKGASPRKLWVPYAPNLFESSMNPTAVQEINEICETRIWQFLQPSPSITSVQHNLSTNRGQKI
jgi:hypothetical protein